MTVEFLKLHQVGKKEWHVAIAHNETSINKHEETEIIISAFRSAQLTINC